MSLSVVLVTSGNMQKTNSDKLQTKNLVSILKKAFKNLVFFCPNFHTFIRYSYLSSP